MAKKKNVLQGIDGRLFPNVGDPLQSDEDFFRNPGILSNDMKMRSIVSPIFAIQEHALTTVAFTRRELFFC